MGKRGRVQQATEIFALLPLNLPKLPPPAPTTTLAALAWAGSIRGKKVDLATICTGDFDARGSSVPFVVLLNPLQQQIMRCTWLVKATHKDAIESGKTVVSWNCLDDDSKAWTASRGVGKDRTIQIFPNVR